MSRIYEALKRAEADGTVSPALKRAMEEREKEQREKNGAAAETAVPAPPQTAPERPLAARAAAAAPAHNQAAISNLLESVVRRPWNPSLSTLPALLSHGPIVEQFRSLRSRLFELRKQIPLKTVLIGSGIPQEGKSFVAANLAISLARNKGSKVLLIDGDMRRSTLHKALGCEAQPGLPDYLSGKVEALDLMQRADPAHHPADSFSQLLGGLFFIPGGASGDDAADLSGNRRFEELIAAVAPSFEWIVVDSSPVIPTSDAVNLARACDGVLLIARAGVTQFEIAQRAQQELRSSRVLGVVLNAAQEAPIGGHYYGYKYGPSKSEEDASTAGGKDKRGEADET